jgi:hypothetical protein
MQAFDSLSRTSTNASQ